VSTCIELILGDHGGEYGKEGEESKEDSQEEQEEKEVTVREKLHHRPGN
jgi:hypothetical protein